MSEQNPDDRTLLEMAALAAGYDDAEFQDMEGWGEVRYGFSCAIWSKKLYDHDGSGYWNPLVDDGQALRLAVKLGLTIDPSAITSSIFAGAPGDENGVGGGYADEFVGSDPYAATRRAIVRAAAQIGRTGSGG